MARYKFIDWLFTKLTNRNLTFSLVTFRQLLLSLSNYRSVISARRRRWSGGYKKLVIHKWKASNVPVHSLVFCLADCNGLPNPSWETVTFLCDNPGFLPVNDMIFFTRVIHDCWLVKLCYGCLLYTSCEPSLFLMFHFFPVLLHSDSKISSRLTNADLVTTFTRVKVVTRSILELAIMVFSLLLEYKNDDGVCSINALNISCIS